MNNNFFKEIKYRCFLIFLNWFFFTNLLYYYKEILLFIIFKKLSYFNSLEFYLVYTNITELFTIYIKLINFCNLQITFGFILYQIIIFCLPTFYKKEFKIIISILLLFHILNSIYIMTFTKLSFFIINFLKNFQEPYIYFEIKIYEIFQFLLKIFLHFQFIFISLSVFFIVYIRNNIMILRKLYYFLLIIISTCYLINILIFKVNVFYFIIISFELFIFLVLLKAKIKG